METFFKIFLTPPGRSIAVVTVVAGGAVFRDLRSGNRADRATDECAGAVADESARASPDRAADESAALTGSARGHGRSGEKGETEEGQFH